MRCTGAGLLGPLNHEDMWKNAKQHLTLSASVPPPLFYGTFHPVLSVMSTPRSFVVSTYHPQASFVRVKPKKSRVLCVRQAGRERETPGELSVPVSLTAAEL